MKDLQTREDIDELMRRFYSRAMADTEIGYLFTDIAKLDLESHLPVIGDFWESVVFGRALYQRHHRNPLGLHLQLHERSPLTQQHFAKWIEIFESSIDSTYSGPNADSMKLRARSIANRFLLAIEMG